jgi:creatine kinase
MLLLQLFLSSFTGNYFLDLLTMFLFLEIGHCIKTGIDNKGHPMIETCGLVAGDEESWTLFGEVKDKVVSDRHGGYAPDAKHPIDMNPANLSKRKIDPTGKYVLATGCRTGWEGMLD